MDRNRGFDINSLRQQIEDLLEDFSGGRRPQSGRGAGGDQPQHLSLNIADSENTLVVTAPLPGLTPEEIDITVRGQSLSIRGHQKSPTGDKPNYIRREWGFGPYQRTVELPSPVEADKAEASFRHGVVTITLPKADLNKSRTIALDEEEVETVAETPESEETPVVEEAVEEAVAEVEPVVVEEVPAQETATEPEPVAEAASLESPAVPEAVPAPESEPVAEEPPTRFYMRPPRRRGGQSRARGAKKAAAEKPAEAPATEPAPSADVPPAE